MFIPDPNPRHDGYGLRITYEKKGQKPLQIHLYAESVFDRDTDEMDSCYATVDASAVLQLLAKGMAKDGEFEDFRAGVKIRCEGGNVQWIEFQGKGEYGYSTSYVSYTPGLKIADFIADIGSHL